MRKKRNEIGIVIEFFSFLLDNENCNISAISRAVNLSHYATVELIKKLELQGMVFSKDKAYSNRHEIPRGKLYFVTEKGKIFFENFKKFEVELKEMDLI